MNDYYDTMAEQEMFDEQWVSRADYNDLMDRCQAAEHDAECLRKKAEKLDALLRNYEDLQSHVEGVLFNLRKSSDELLRTIEIIEQDVETERL